MANEADETPKGTDVAGRLDGLVGPRLDYVLKVHEQMDGFYYITSSVPGLHLAGPDLAKLLADVPLSVATLRRLNGDERPNA